MKRMKVNKTIIMENNPNAKRESCSSNDFSIDKQIGLYEYDKTHGVVVIRSLWRGI